MEIVEGTPMTDTRYVSQYFGIRHDNTLRSADTVMSADPTLRDLIFQESFYFNALETGPRRLYRCIKMAEEGFILLAMGFTRPSALKFKRAFYAKFAKMRQTLRDEHDAYAKLNDPIELRQLQLN